MPEHRTCFIISPIGDKDSDIRRHADALIKRVISPALSGMDFSITRVDQSFANSRISDEIITLIKNSDLCVVDSYGYNPNVMYELGRRHETGKPVLLMRPEGQQIIFDLKDIKHIEYDLESVDAVIDVQHVLRGYIGEFLKQGFISTDTTNTLDAIASAVGRVERRIDDLAKLTTMIPANKPSLVSSQSTTEILKSLGPARGLEYCLQEKLTREAEEIFSLSEQKMSREVRLSWISGIAGTGSHIMLKRIESEIFPSILDVEEEDRRYAVSSYVSGSNILDIEEGAIEILVPLIEDVILGRHDKPDADKAFYFNQLAKLYYGCRKFGIALEYNQKAIRLAPADPAYNYNAAGAAFANNDIDLAVKYIQLVLDISRQKNLAVDTDYLEIAHKIFKQAGRMADASDALNKIQQVNPLLASMIAQR